MSGPTPGVWRAEGVGNVFWTVVADLPDGWGADVASMEIGPTGQAEANAKLMAAAPEMARELVDLLRRLSLRPEREARIRALLERAGVPA
jgi:hypothetical protein